MKKSKKLGAIALCSIVSASSILAGPVVEDKLFADDIKLENLQSTYAIDAQGQVFLPLGSAGTSMTVTAVGSGEAVTDLTTTDQFFSFKPTASQYVVTYTNGTTEKSFTINIDYKDATMELDESSVILPETALKGTEILLPYPIVTDQDGNDITDFNCIKISASNKSLNAVTVEQSTTVYKGEVKYNKITPATAGTYTIVYTFDKTGYDKVSKTYTINVKQTLNMEATISFSLNSKLGTPTLGKEFNLPRVTAKDTTNELDNIKVRTDISYYILDKNGNKSNEYKVKDFSFTPEEEGSYVFKYEVTDAYGNKAPIAYYKTDYVKDTSAPTSIKFFDSYKIGTDNEPYKTDSGDNITNEKAYDISYIVPSNVTINPTTLKTPDVTIPAVYATDADTELTYVRTLKRYVGGVIEEEILLDSDHTKADIVNFTTAGTYTLTYSVKDSNLNEISKEFYINVKSASDTWTDTSAPTITFSANIDESTKWGSKLSINKPSVVDYNDDNLIADKNTQTVASIYYKADDGISSPLTTNKTILNLNSSNKYDIELYDNIDMLESALSVNDLSNYTVYLCFEFSATDDHGNTTTQTKEIKVVGDTEVPNAVYNAPATVVYNQGDEVSLGELIISYSSSKFTDYLKDISVQFDIVNRETKSPIISYGTKYDFSTANTVRVYGTKFTASYAGNYDVVITITDINGNTVVTTTSVEGVTAIFHPEVVLEKDTLTLELGTTDTSAKIYTMYNNGQVVAATDKNIKIEVINGESVAIDSNLYFKAMTRGESIVKYTMYSEDGLTELASKQLVITVSDTKDPEIVFSVDNPFKSVNSIGNAITLPTPVISDNDTDAQPTLEITVKLNGTNVTITNNTFTPNEAGTYEVVYKVTDISGNSASKTFNVAVGDMNGPIIDIRNVPANKEVGSYYTIDLENDLDIYDDYETDFEYTLGTGGNTTITLKDAEGNEIKGENYSYKLDKAGTYTLIIEAKDSANKTTKIEKTITVSEKVAEPAQTSTAGTVVLILASLLILALVIYYFFKPEKPSKKDNSSKNSKKDNK